MTPAPRLLSAFALLGASACVPEFDDDGSRIDAARVIAIQATPAEVDLRSTSVTGEVALEAVVAAREADAEGDIAWTLCVDRKPLSELGPVSTRCLASPEPGPEIAVPLGHGTQVSAVLPELACQLFGPERPDPEPGQPAGRPVDPDPTGGFYVPVLAWLGQDVVLGSVRITCGLLHVSPATSQAFTARYRLNENPVVERLELVASDGSSTELSAGNESVTVAAGATITLRVAWPDCPTTPVCGDGICGTDETASEDADLAACPDDCAEPKGCGGAETYVSYDPETARITQHRESLVVAWYATGGTFASERTDENGRSGDLPASENGWVAPQAGAIRLWAVLRDERGGVSSFQANLAVNN